MVRFQIYSETESTDLLINGICPLREGKESRIALNWNSSNGDRRLMKGHIQCGSLER